MFRLNFIRGIKQLRSRTSPTIKYTQYRCRLLTSITSKKESGPNTFDDFFTHHSGKVGISAILLAVYFFYSYYESTQQRLHQEELLQSRTSVEPNEINNLRREFKISASKYENFVFECLNQFPHRKCNYSEFISFAKLRLSELAECRSCYLFDRLIIAHISQLIEVDISNGVNKDISAYDIPVAFFLTALSMAVSDGPERRCDMLFRLGVGLSRTTYSLKEAEQLNNVEDKCSRAALETVLESLATTHQIPVGKLVTETGTKYPWVTYRLKTANDMCEGYAKSFKPSISVPEQWSQEEFRQLLMGNQVCVWGTCFHSSH